MGDIIPFKYGSKQLRAITINDDPWFITKDACDILSIGNSRDAISRLDSDEKGVATIDTLGGPQEMSIVSEPGLYSLILGSKKPEARPFKRWVTHEVIPTIRKHGAYMTPETIERTLTDPDFIIRLATELKEERAQKEALAAQIKSDAPKVNFANSVAGSVNSILIRDLAKLLAQNGHDIGEKRLFQWMRNNGYLISKFGRDYNSPTQKSMDLGLMEVKETAIDHASGYSETKRTPLITGKGQQYFIGKFVNMPAA